MFASEVLGDYSNEHGVLNGVERRICKKILLIMFYCFKSNQPCDCQHV